MQPLVKGCRTLQVSVRPSLNSRDGRKTKRIQVIAQEKNPELLLVSRVEITNGSGVKSMQKKRDKPNKVSSECCFSAWSEL